jgi:hypothetical protein
MDNDKTIDLPRGDGMRLTVKEIGLLVVLGGAILSFWSTYSVNAAQIQKNADSIKKQWEVISDVRESQIRTETFQVDMKNDIKEIKAILQGGE